MVYYYFNYIYDKICTFIIQLVYLFTCGDGFFFQMCNYRLAPYSVVYKIQILNRFKGSKSNLDFHDFYTRTSSRLYLQRSIQHLAFIAFVFTTWCQPHFLLFQWSNKYKYIIRQLVAIFSFLFQYLAKLSQLDHLTPLLPKNKQIYICACQCVCGYILERKIPGIIYTF